MVKVLLIDDDVLVCKTIQNIVQKMDYDSTCAYSIKEGEKLVMNGSYDIVFLDVHLPDGNGLSLLPLIKSLVSPPEVIIMTGYGDPDGAELAIKNGAWDYIQKPFSPKPTMLLISRALKYRSATNVPTIPKVFDRHNILGKSEALNEAIQNIALAAGSDVNVLLTGETGTGKELFAQAIHHNSSRAKQPFIVVDCATLPETLVESVLFGHEKGSYTGADKKTDGLITQADKGTLFLDEIGELPLNIQKSFLRVLQEHRFRAVGGRDEISSSFRLITATNRNLEEMVQKKEFREDLFFRIRTATINLPPLRERAEDIREISSHYIQSISDKYGFGVKGCSPEFWETLQKHHWPGNIRELIQTMEVTILNAQHDPIIFDKHLPMQLRINVKRATFSEQEQKKITAPYPEKKPSKDTRMHTDFDSYFYDSKGELKAIQEFRTDILENVEPKYLIELLEFCKGNIKKACHISGLSRSRLYSLLQKYDISGVKSFR